jgi:propanediol dehydratase small subunit
LAIGYFYTVSSMRFDPSRDYPLGASRPELVRTPGGLALDQLALHDERVTAAELRATPDTLRMQADVARAAGRAQLADNLLRAAELALVPDETILEIYTALRPRRSSAAELEAWAVRLEEAHAEGTAAFVREAAQVYAERGLLRAG